MKIDLELVAESIFFLIVIYFIVGGFSILAVAVGEEIPYMPFWHYPWKLLFNFLIF